MPSPHQNGVEQTLSEPAQRYLAEFNQRYRELHRAQNRQSHDIQSDFFANLLDRYFSFNDQRQYDGLLRRMLTDAELQRMQTDLDYGRAWHTFVNHRWQRKQLTKGLLLVCAITLVLAMAALLLFGFRTATQEIGSPGRIFEK